jgi:hypothetical protein
MRSSFYHTSSGMIPFCLGFDRILNPWYSYPAGLLLTPFYLNPICPRRFFILKGQYHILYCIGISYEMALVISGMGRPWFGFQNESCEQDNRQTSMLPEMFTRLKIESCPKIKPF